MLLPFWPLIMMQAVFIGSKHKFISLPKRRLFIANENSNAFSQILTPNNSVKSHAGDFASRHDKRPYSHSLIEMQFASMIFHTKNKETISSDLQTDLMQNGSNSRSQTIKTILQFL